MRSRIRRPGATLLLIGPVVFAVSTQPAASGQHVTDFAAIETSYVETTRPLLRRFCLDCHSTEQSEGELDLERFARLADVRREPKVWQRVAEMLADGEMPPKESEQPTPRQRRELADWTSHYLRAEALAAAGDPGPVVLRRLSNAEYNYTISDLTGLKGLNPTEQFPVDGAAGEGFTNAGSGQSMSPSLVQKYLDAAKGIAAHAVVLPPPSDDGHVADAIRFSPHQTRRDWTDELLARIRDFYARHTERRGQRQLTLQEVSILDDQDGLLPLVDYLTATLRHRDDLRRGIKSIEQVAKETDLSAKYLASLWSYLNEPTSSSDSFLLSAVRERWQEASVNEVDDLAAEIVRGQAALWKFNPIGHIGRQGGPKGWMEAVSSISTRVEINRELAELTPDDSSEPVIFLAAQAISEAPVHVVLHDPRIEFAEPGMAPIPLRELRRVARQTLQLVDSELPRTGEYLAGLRMLHQRLETGEGNETPDQIIRQIAAKRDLQPRLLEGWSQMVGLHDPHARAIVGHLRQPIVKEQGYEAINGWRGVEAMSVLTNRSEEPITFLTLTVPPRGVTMHPMPQQMAVAAWRSPVAGTIRITGRVADADDKCGNGFSWYLESVSRFGSTRYADGVVDNGQQQRIEVAGTIDVEPDDLIRLVIVARDRSHACDTTHIELTLTEAGAEGRRWDLATDVVDNIRTGNPLPDSHGHADVWHFLAQDDAPAQPAETMPANSSLARWREALISGDADQVKQLASRVQSALTTAEATSLSEPDRTLRARMTDWRGPLGWLDASNDVSLDDSTAKRASDHGLDPELFGIGPDDRPLDSPNSLCFTAPQSIGVRLPPQLIVGAKFVASATIHAQDDARGAAQLQLLAAQPESLLASAGEKVLLGQASQIRPLMESQIDRFRQLFPPALCYARIVPVDEVVTLALFHREDDHLKRLMLSEKDAALLDRMWEELLFVSREPQKLVVALEQIREFATQDRPDLVKAFAPYEQPVAERAARFEQQLIDAEPSHLDAVEHFADRAWRRPLSKDERQSLRQLYRDLRAAELNHEASIRLVIAKILTSPDFLYRRETPVAGKEPGRISDTELASRLSYFLWSSMPDQQLRDLAKSGRLFDQLVDQSRRMRQDPRVRRLAVQFACQWLHLRLFDEETEKNEKLYPEFASMRSDMLEETVLFFEDMFRNDGSILDLIDADHTFLNASLARHYGIEGVQGAGWQRVDGVRAAGRGGVLGMATVLASQSGVSRTSPILRGNWVYETLLGKRLPRPPANVPQLPEDVPEGLTARQLIELHSGVDECAKCHRQIDPYGFALEQYDTIGRLRSQVVDTTTVLPDGNTLKGIEGLRTYLLDRRRDEIVAQFCRKLLGYALGREIQLSDQPLLERMSVSLKDSGYRFSVAMEAIVTSDQFLKIRGTKWGVRSEE